MTTPNWTPEQTREVLATVKGAVRALVTYTQMPPGLYKMLTNELDSLPCPTTPPPSNGASADCTAPAADPAASLVGRRWRSKVYEAKIYEIRNGEVWCLSTNKKSDVYFTLTDFEYAIARGELVEVVEEKPKAESDGDRCWTAVGCKALDTRTVRFVLGDGRCVDFYNFCGSGPDAVRAAECINKDLDLLRALHNSAIATLTRERDEAIGKQAKWIGIATKLEAERDQLRSELAALRATPADLPSAESVAKQMTEIRESTVYLYKVRQLIADAITADRQRRMPTVDWVEKACEAYKEWQRDTSSGHFVRWLRAREAKGGGK